MSHTFDALLPQEIARKAEEAGVTKTRRGPVQMFTLALLAGAFIGFGAMFATTTLAGGEALPYGVARLLAGLVFSLGLILVVVGGAELFTGNVMATMALASGRIGWREMLRAWAIVYVGNLAGAIGLAVLVYLSGQFLNGGIAAVAVKIGIAKASLPFDRALYLGILCNVLVCLAVWLAMSARSTEGKIAAIVFPITAFVAAGFEHSIANAYFLPMALLIKYSALPFASHALDAENVLTVTNALRNLLAVTIGNTIGGGLLVGLVYWFVYLWPERETVAKKGCAT
jgi:formate/nitrite transporter